MASAPTTIEQIVQKGGMLHKLSVVDDKNNVSLLGTLLDDTTGPPSQQIINHLVCRNEYEKNLPVITQFPSFALVAYSKEKDYRRITDFIAYLNGRKKAAKVLLDKHGAVGYLFPGPAPATPEGIPCLRCYHQTAAGISAAQASRKRPVPTDTAGAGAGAGAAGGVAASPGGAGAGAGAAAKRPRGAKPVFKYIPPDAPPPPSTTTTKATKKKGDEEEDGPTYNPTTAGGGNGHANGGDSDTHPPPPLPDPSQFPRSKDPRFKYIPPTPTDGVIPPPFYDDPDAAPAFDPAPSLSEEQIAMLAASAGSLSSLVISSPRGLGAPGLGGGGGGGASAAPAAAAGGAAWGKDQKVAAGFYNSLKREKGTRNQSLVFHMRKLNNWVKAQLINGLRPAEGSGARELEVLDLACGKGGDFTKWREVSRRYPIARYVGVDIAKESLVDAIGRYNSDKHIRTSLGSALTLGCADLGATDLINDDVDVWEATEDRWSKRPLLDEEDQFDVITMQFALHYMFEDERRARHFLQVVAQHLRVGGSFIATTVDARVVVEMLAGLGKEERGTGEWVARLVDEEKRELCRLAVDRETYTQIFQPPSPPGGETDTHTDTHTHVEKETPFCGLRYKFLLRDGSEEDGAADAVNAPEWMIPLPFLTEVAEEYGLSLEKAQNFHELIHENRAMIGGEGANRGIRWVNYQGSISKTEWDIARIYVALKFTRVR